MYQKMMEINWEKYIEIRMKFNVRVLSLIQQKINDDDVFGYNQRLRRPAQQ